MDSDHSEETSPLLGKTYKPQVNLPISTISEHPPLYDPSAYADGILAIACKICSTLICIKDKTNQLVVKCDNCKEATAIKPPPVGKQYVRCLCNCLLVCAETSQRIACPRANCNRIITLMPDSRIPSSLNDEMDAISNSGPQPGRCRVTCGHCFNSFLFNTLNNQLARCPHCRKLSSVGPEFARFKGLAYLILSIVLFIITLGTTLGTLNYVKSFIALAFVYAGLFFVVFFLILRSTFYFTMKVSMIENVYRY